MKKKILIILAIILAISIVFIATRKPKAKNYINTNIKINGESVKSIVPIEDTDYIVP